MKLRLSRHARGAAFGATALALAIALFAQQPTFIEVASIKPSRDALGDSNLDSAHGRLTAANITVRELIRFAYGLRDYQIRQAPGWIGARRFDISLKMVPAAGGSLEDEKSAVRELLASRFQLTIHRELKQMPVFLLIVSKDGPQLPPHNPAAPRTRSGCGRLAGRRVTADVLAAMLARQVEREVVNRTRLSGEYDVQLDFTPDSGPCRAAPAAPSDPPSIYTAIQQQLGLKLVSSKAPVETLVIDRVERPSEN